ncbi:MAG: ABC transporter ATP-binding protein [Nitrospinae bacterium]|nr:ABC transporter ATP-binding protein [Nitrospinota bacterium]
MSAILNAVGVTKLYIRGAETVRALDNINISIERGDMVAVVGPSGSGKTTLLNMLGGFDKPTNGSIYLKEFEISNMKEKELNLIRRKEIGYIFQNFHLLPTLTVRENISIPLIFSGKKEDGRVERVLEVVGLSNRANHLPSQISGGEMQRTAIARALINDPEILIADEPTGNLDSEMALSIFNLFNSINQQEKTIIIVTHNLELAKKCRRCLHIKDGRIE